MKVKDIDRTANIAWSPGAHHPIYLAAGTAAQQLDATFSTSASLEIYDLNLADPSFDMLLKGRISSDHRFHKIAWGCVGMNNSEQSSGILVGGADGGNILMYDPAKLLAGEEALLYHKTNHTGPVHSLDFNKFQECLLASGASDSEIFIWDLTNPSSPMTPGSKAQPSEDVTSVAWNCQVQHILASTFLAKCVVWDLRKNEPIIKVSDPASKLLRYKMVTWHPDVATQLCLASEDDHCPLIQLWDLRFATSPVRNLEQHQRGVLSIAWCPQDPDLLLSCGKDNRILCWNPNSPVEGGEVLCELPTSNQWSFDVAWCPRNPAVIASSSCDGHICAHSLMSGSQKSVQCSSKIAESFPGSEKILVQPNIPIQNQAYSQVSLKTPPKWLRRPVGGTFAFGGKLVYFSGLASQQYIPQVHGTVKISQVITEPSLLNKVSELETALSARNIAEFCQRKVEACTDRKEQMKWSFLEATFSSAPRAKMLSLLGYDTKPRMSLDGDQNIVDNVATLSLSTSNSGSSDSTEFDAIASQSKDFQDEPFVINTDSGNLDALLNRALLRGDIEMSVEYCISEKRWADALVLAQAGGYELFQKTQRSYFQSVTTSSSKLISAVATSNWLTIIKNCEISSWKECLAAILTYAKPDEFAQLCELLGSRLENEHNSAFIHNAALCYISSGNLERLAELWTKTNGNLEVNSIQGLIEQLMVLREAVHQLSGNSPPLMTGPVSNILGQFSAILAAQGNLKSALMYLVDPKERSLAILRDRILQSLGLQSPFFPFERYDVPKHLPTAETSRGPQFTRTRQPSLPKEQHLQQSFYQPYKPAPPQPAQQFQPYASPPVQPPLAHQTQPHTYSLASSMPSSGTFQASPPPHVSTAANIPQSMPVSASMPPPPPADTPNIYAGKSSSGHPLSHRYPKNLHDPSVYSDNMYSGQQYYPTPQQTYGVSAPAEMSFSQPFSMQQPVSSYSTEQNMNVAYSQSSIPPYSTASSYEYSSSVPSSGVSELPPIAPMQMPTSSIYTDSKTGWNDPPLLKSSTLAPSQSFQPQSAITAPFGTDPSISILQPMAPVPPVYNPNAYAPQPQMMAPQPQMMMPGAVREPPPAIQPQQSLPELPKEKSTIPPQHQIIQDTLEDLRQQCQHATTNPQTRRKLEDVAKKLEILYDQLGDKSLSASIEDGLHQIVQSIVQSDYSAALTVHGLLVSSANFSEICGFMPSIKVLIQTAIQHNVFLQ